MRKQNQSAIELSPLVTPLVTSDASKKRGFVCFLPLPFLIGITVSARAGGSWMLVGGYYRTATNGRLSSCSSAMNAVKMDCTCTDMSKKSKDRWHDPALLVAMRDHATYPSTFLYICTDADNCSIANFATAASITM